MTLLPIGAKAQSKTLLQTVKQSGMLVNTMHCVVFKLWGALTAMTPSCPSSCEQGNNIAIFGAYVRCSVVKCLTDGSAAHRLLQTLEASWLYHTNLPFQLACSMLCLVPAAHLCWHACMQAEARPG